MLSSVHLEILHRVADGALPAAIDAQSGVDLVAFVQLWRAGLLDAIDASAGDGDCFLHPTITLAGLRHLAEQSPSTI